MNWASILDAVIGEIGSRTSIGDGNPTDLVAVHRGMYFA
ncbi:hypothetical protein CAter282_0261 [Collimonas arenae]|uniref:Uncharacterized protein n=1 Tax=Collimonas arenae TaxID=279058 RepID=A0A127QDC7_9BURK|nr:hypothetical protein CAter282_0261 [Collimonas arenae]